MDMTFSPWSSYQLTLIFDWWRVETHTQYVTTWVAVCIAAAAFHGLRYATTFVEMSLSTRLANSRLSQKVRETTANTLEAGMGLEETFLVPDRGSSGGVVLNTFEKRQILILRATHAGLSGLSYMWSLLLMLVAMTYNPGLFVALVLGYALGDFLFFSRTVGLAGEAGAGRLQGSSTSGGGGGSGSAVGAAGGWTSYKYGNECH